MSEAAPLVRHRFDNEVVLAVEDTRQQQLPELEPSDYERTVQTLLSGGSDPVITKAPEGAWTHAITDKAKSM